MTCSPVTLDFSRKETAMRKTTIIALLGAILLASAATAWCNQKKQPKGTAEQPRQPFELPAVPQTAEPFRFENPNPARRLQTLTYTIDYTGKTVLQIGVSGRLSPQRAKAVQEGILRLITESMCRPGDVAVIWDADTLNRVATIRNGDRTEDCSPKWLKFKVAENKADLARLNQHFFAMREQNHQGIADLNLPRLTNFIGQEFHEYSDFPNRILVLYGSAVHVSPDGASSLETSYPTIGSLRAPLSAFSTRDKEVYLGNTVTHFVVNDEDFKNGLHRAGLQNFWAAYFLSQGSPLLTFSPDPRVSERVLNATLPPISAYVDDLNAGFVSVITANVGLFDDLSRDGLPVPSTLQRGALILGLMWPDRKLDLDLHVNLAGQPERLSFRNPRTKWGGTLRKAFGTGWEEVYFSGEMDPATDRGLGQRLRGRCAP